MGGQLVQLQNVSRTINGLKRANLPLNYSPKPLIRRRFFRSPKVLSLCLASGIFGRLRVEI